MIPTSQMYREFIEKYLHDHYAQFHNEPQKELFSAMEYSLFAGGKRLRPIFTLEFCRMTCGDWKKAAPYAAAVEMIQTYSLIHDDLPCMDNDDFRRGKPTNHKVYGEGLAVLAGDALLTDAFAMVSKGEENTAMAVAVLAECAGSLGMVGGQVLDIQSEQRQLTEQEVLDIQTRKTGALINAACVLGVLAGNGTQVQIEAASRFAACLGLAFQIRDDMLDVIGTKEEMGKGVGTDEQKNTFVRLYGLERCEKLVQKYTDIAISALEAFENADFLCSLARDMTSRRT